MKRNLFLLILLFLFIPGLKAETDGNTPVPGQFPEFIVPGYEAEMASLRTFFYQQYQTSGPLIPLWDEWLPMSTLWPAAGKEDDTGNMRHRWRQTLRNRFINGEGYVITQQHDGPAHAEGWPFPLWQQGNGVGWHFRSTGIPVYDGPEIITPEAWEVSGGESGPVIDRGWEVRLTAPGASVLSPEFSFEAAEYPWLRLNWWGSGLKGANCYVEWTTEAHPEFSPERRAYFTLSPFDQRIVGHPRWAPENQGGTDRIEPEARTMIPVYRVPSWKGNITRFRIVFDNKQPMSVVIKSFHVAYDTRHNVNNINYIRGCHDYFLWTRDIAFLRSEIDRIRFAMRFVQREFRPREKKCIYTTWPGHEGTSGIRYVNGEKKIVTGAGIGSNYWDLLPFGGEDALATIYYYDALKDLSTLEEAIVQHPEWCIPSGGDAFDPGKLRAHAREVKAYGTQRFWNEETGRFGTVDLEGNMHDYGFTFLNNEAIHFNFATPEQARSIQEWLSGKRIVGMDTSIGEDIYHWRFGPRSSTKRNTDYYFWGYQPTAWGESVQDGGAILAWSYYDLMAKIKVLGPEAALGLLEEIIRWYDDTQKAGGFRAYYNKYPERGKLQGGNVAGGLGVDMEFKESILVPQVMLYGFLGFFPGVDGFSIRPNLPEEWPSLTIDRIRYRDLVLTIKVTRDKTITVTGTGKPGVPLEIDVPRGYELVNRLK